MRMDILSLISYIFFISSFVNKFNLAGLLTLETESEAREEEEDESKLGLKVLALGRWLL
jgi:hypothetical protein